MNHPTKSAAFLADTTHSHWHDQALWFVRQKRDTATKTIPEWETLRQLASQIKAHTMSRLDHYLERFERNATRNGIHIHWAVDADEHNRIVGAILKRHNVRKVVKSKSMLTEECGLNPYLQTRDIDVIDTDLGERIVQLRNEPPSHIVLPAIHLKKEQVGTLFETEFGTELGNADPTYLTYAARQHLREHFLSADAALTGVNFAVADEGLFVVCTNEGNADLGTAITDLHIASMGIEKIIPSLEHLGIFTRLLARSATGQPVTTYTSHFKRPKPGGELHIVIVDNGRSAILGSDTNAQALHCIRCGACMNTCPTYRRSGGHSYDYVIPGPIGSTLGASRNLQAHGDLTYNCTLCGSCTSVCPARIDLHHQLYAWRKEYVEAGYMSAKKIWGFRIGSWMLRSPRRAKMLFGTAKWVTRFLPRSILYTQANVWGRTRELPTFAPKTFAQLYKEHTREP
jgi:L-lactate dehydrogenase complex protein LldF